MILIGLKTTVKGTSAKFDSWFYNEHSKKKNQDVIQKEELDKQHHSVFQKSWVC